MADGHPGHQRGGAPDTPLRNTPKSRRRRSSKAHRTPTLVHHARFPFHTDTPSPSRSPRPHSSPRFAMYSQNHQHSSHNSLVGSGASHQRYAMPMSLGKPFQPHQGTPMPPHQHPPHQDHPGSSHGVQFVNHQHSISGGALSNPTPGFAPGHVQNGTPGSVSSDLPQPQTEFWKEQHTLAARAREMSQPHSYARTHPTVNKSVVAGTNNGAQQDAEDKVDGRPAVFRTEDTGERHVWTTLDFSGQSLRVVSMSLFHYDFLTKLYLNCNKLVYLPPLVGRLRNLTFLDVSLNELRTLPRELGMLVNLRQLLLFHNRIESLPFEMGSLHHLEVLGIEGNHDLPDDLRSILYEHGTTELIKYMRENAQGPDPPPERDWIVVNDLSDPAAETVTALSYNILCDKYCTEQLYGYTPSAALSWDHRKEVVLAELRERNADVMCLQEIDQGNFNEFFRGSLAHNGYKGLFWPKSRARIVTEKEKKQVDGCAIFYKNSKYVLLDKHVIDFANTAINRPDMKGEHDIFNRVMPRDDIAVVAFLENRVTGTRLIVATTHIFWNPVYKDVKLVQIAILMEQVTKLAQRYAKWPAALDKTMYRFTNGDNDAGRDVPDTTMEPGPSREYADGVSIPMILCGDFNSMPNSGVYDLIAHGKVAHSHDDFGSSRYGDFTRDGIVHPFSLKSSYASVGEPAFTNYTPTFAGVLDYIFYSHKSLQVLGLLGNVDEHYLRCVPGFPNYHFPSDHLPLLVQYAVKTRKDPRLEVESDQERGKSRRA